MTRALEACSQDVAKHRLAPLLSPRSIALVGASPRPGSYGNAIVQELRRSEFPGKVYLVNPKYEEIEGLPCYSSLGALPEVVDLAAFCIANHRLEARFEEAAAVGVRAAVIFGSCNLENDREPLLLERLNHLAREAGMTVCGGNCMGFYNLDASVRVCCFEGPEHLEPGSITLITHSGSPFEVFVHNDPRLTFNLAVHSGQEITTTVADYMDFALDMPSTRVIALFIEAVRDPARFVAALEKALARNIPIVVLKFGRTQESARLMLSHCGALAGDDAAFSAVCERYCVFRVNTYDELAATVLFFAQPRRPTSGGLAAILDSGGAQQMLVDLAEDAGVPFARITPSTKQKLKARIEYGAEPENPLDAWGTGADYKAKFNACFSALVDDPDTAIGTLFSQVRRGYTVYEADAEVCRTVFSHTKKSVCLVTLGAVRNDELALKLIREGIPVLDGVWPALVAIRHALAYRDFRNRSSAIEPPQVPEKIHDRWRQRLSEAEPLDEVQALALLADYRIPTVPVRLVNDIRAALLAARELGYPIAMKTAEPGVLHKSGLEGVKLGLRTPDQVCEAYEDLARRLGPRVVVAPMAPPGVEMALGVVVDPQFGPMVMVAAGGILVEVLRDRRFALAPMDRAAAERLVNGIAARRLLDGIRGRPPADVNAFVESVVRLSILAADLGDLLETVDINPIIVGTKGCVAVDALVVQKKARVSRTGDAMTSGGGAG